MKSFLSIMATLLGFSFAAQATPSQIIIVRHGEKISDTDRGVSPQGCERAYQLPQFFQAYQANVVGIYAQQAEKKHSSIRPLETIAPTAKELGLKINNSFLRDDVKGIAEEILKNSAYDGKTIFISWEHTAILNLVAALGLELPKNLQEWPGSIFDQAWILTFNAVKPTLSIVAELALPTDIVQIQSGISNWGKEDSPSNNGVTVPAATISECNKGNSSLDQIVKEQALVAVPGL